MKKTTYISLCIGACVLSGCDQLQSNHHGNASYCVDQMYQNTPPFIQNEKLRKDNYALCYQGFSVLYSGVSKTPLWVAEKLDKDRLSQKVKRQDSFFEEQRLAAKHQSTLKDYRASGYDRGHMAPNGDMGTVESGKDSFTLTNIVPQSPKNNQGIWRDLEQATRELVKKYNQDAYIITGALFENRELKTIGSNRVFIPSSVYKIVYMPNAGIVGAYYAPNDDSQRVEIISICELERKAGINFFPNMDHQLKTKISDLPLRSHEIKQGQQLTASQSKHKHCAETVTLQQQQWQKEQFQWNHFSPLDYRGIANIDTTTAAASQTAPSATERILTDIALMLISLIK